MSCLYFYKLVSNYPCDVTKNCKLTINEIDTNFLHLKDEDIKSAEFDEATNHLILTRNDGEQLVVDLSSLLDGAVKNLSVSYDINTGTITIRYGDEVTTIDGLVTEATLEDCKKVITDGTINGNGTAGEPLGINPLELTGQFAPVIGFIDMTTVPPGQLPAENALGDRYITLEKSNRAGYLYKFAGVKEIEEYLNMLANGWRIPTKEDWDNMLNAIEPCAEARNHGSSMSNMQLGMLAGKYLKSLDTEIHSGREIDIWNTCDESVSVNCGGCDDALLPGDSYTTIVDEDGDELNVKTITPNGIDSYGFRVLPTGYHDGCEVQYYCGEKAGLWTNTVSNITDVYVKRFDANKAGVVQIAVSPLEMHGLRLVKDYDGSNYHPSEVISGITYNTVMMPSIGADHGYTIWTADNFGSKTSEGTYTEVGECLDELNDADGNVYYLNYWDGFCWRKRPLGEGDSVVIYTAYTDGSGHTYTQYAEGLTAVHDIEFRIIDGVLVAVNDVLFQDLLDSFSPSIDSLEEKIDEVKAMVEDEQERAMTAEAELDEKIDNLAESVAEMSGFGDSISALTAGLEEESIERQLMDNAILSTIGQGFSEENTVKDYIDEKLGRLINSGSTFSVSNGFAFSHDDASNNYTLYLDGNYGEIPEE